VQQLNIVILTGLADDILKTNSDLSLQYLAAILGPPDSVEGEGNDNSSFRESLIILAV